MSYEVLARKWRPQTFDEVVGQDHITRTLKKAVESGRLSHAYMFAGPRGCGKTSTARIMAKVINCTDLHGGNPCNACPSCVGVAEGRNLDVMEIDGASHTGVGEVRDLQESIGYAASQFGKKVYIIDEVHMLSTHAFNALLKTLEEPPAHVYFIFATTAPHKIPDTIKSRCQRHQFKRLEISEITGQLTKICKAEKVKCEDDALRLLARKAEGSMRDAESLLDQCITASSGDVSTGAVRDILGLLDHEMVHGFLETMAGHDATAVLKRLDEAVGQGVDLEELLNALIEGFRDLMLLAASDDLRDLVFRSQDDIARLVQLTESYELPDLVTIVERLCNTAPRLKLASDPRVLLESVLVDLALLDRQTDIRALIESIERTGSSGGPSRPKPAPKTTPRRPPKSSASAVDEFATRPAAVADAAPLPAKETPSPEPARAPASPPADVDLSTLGYAEQRKLWDGFVTTVRQKKVALGVCLISGSLKSIEGAQVLLRFAKGFGFQKQQVEEAANKKFLHATLKKYFGRDLELVCFTEGEEAKVAREQMEARQKEKESEVQRPIESRPIVQKILTEFDGEIVRYHPR